ncbi:MAG: restriction endonuclease subunit S [Bacteroidales bacterium]|nr:restriction endonuclease subunit S [Bacteroidales bacterium]
MEKYSSYKDSGIQWLGQIPSHWEVKHLRNFLTMFSEKGFGDAQLLSVTREKGVILRDRDDKEENHNYVPDDLSGYKHLMPGDFVINKMKSWQGSYGVSNYEGIVSPAYFTCKLRGVDPQFFSRAIRSKAYIGFFMQYSKGIRVDQWDLDPSSMKDIPFILPPFEEQKKIVPYLDAATAKIDEAIAQQQRMIDLLNERKQSIIDRVALGGLDSSVELQDSGNDWLGLIPKHWRINKFRYLFKTRTGITFTKAQLEDEGEPVISYGQIHSKDNWGASVNPELIRHIPSELTKGKEGALAMLGDFLFADTSEDFEGCGNNVFIDSEPVYAGYHTILAKKNNQEYGPYLAYLFTSTRWRGQVRSMVNGVKVYSITQGILNSANVILPPKEEQKEIADYITKRVIKLDEGVRRHKEYIKVLQERKQIIINEVVTGKVNVI